jgi:hypothetical protein
VVAGEAGEPVLVVRLARAVAAAGEVADEDSHVDGNSQDWFY